MIAGLDLAALAISSPPPPQAQRNIKFARYARVLTSILTTSPKSAALSFQRLCLRVISAALDSNKKGSFGFTRRWVGGVASPDSGASRARP